MAKILLVEDDKSLREIYGVRLQAEGYTIVSAGDGEEALAMAIKERPDLIVSDVMMPKISGFDMLDILRSTTETKDVKVIMMTALSSDDQRARGEALGADRYLVKSQVGIEDVVRTVHDVLADGLPAPAAPSAAPSFTSGPAAAPAAAPAPVTPEPTPAPVAAPSAPAVPTPVAEPVPAAAPIAPQPVQPVPQPVAPTPVGTEIAAPVAAPVAPVAPVAPAPQPVMATPDYSQPPQPVFPPVQAPAAPAPAAVPVAPTPMPQPTAPFSSSAPASVGERVIQPLTNPGELASPLDLSAQMDQALGNTPNAQTPGTPPVPPVA